VIFAHVRRMTERLGLHGVDKVTGLKLRLAGISNPATMLERGLTPASRMALAADTGISIELIDQWVHQADLCRIRGIGSEYAQLLQAVGIRNVEGLVGRAAGELYEELKATNRREGIIKHLPSESMVYNWVEEARTKKLILM